MEKTAYRQASDFDNTYWDFMYYNHDVKMWRPVRNIDHITYLKSFYADSQNQGCTVNIKWN